MPSNDAFQRCLPTMPSGTLLYDFRCLFFWTLLTILNVWKADWLFSSKRKLFEVRTTFNCVQDVFIHRWMFEKRGTSVTLKRVQFENPIFRIPLFQLIKPRPNLIRLLTSLNALHTTPVRISCESHSNLTQSSSTTSIISCAHKAISFIRVYL